MADTAGTPLLIALGDSITAGVGGKRNRGYPNHLQDLLETHVPGLRMTNWGIPGLTVPRLTKALRKGEHLHDDLREARWIVMTIGGNDIMKALPKKLPDDPALVDALTEAPSLTFARDLDELMTTLRGITDGPIYLGDLYNPFPESPLATALLRLINRTYLEPLAKRYPRLYLVKLSEVIQGEEHEKIQYYKTGTLRDLKKFWRHPVHPNDQGHLLIAESFFRVILAPKAAVQRAKTKPRRKRLAARRGKPRGKKPPKS